MVVLAVLWQAFQFLLREYLLMSVVLFRDELCLESFLLISRSFCKLLSDCHLGDFQHISLKSSFKGYCSIDLSRLPVNLRVDGFQEGVTQENVVMIYFGHKEGMLALVSFAVDL